MTARQEVEREKSEGRQYVSRDDVVEAAFALAESDGLDALTMRKLAARLGRAPMSLYTHVKSREDLVDAMVERLIARLDLGDRPGETWQEALRTALGGYRDLAVRFPRVFELLALAPYDSSPVAPHLARMLARLERGGLEPDQAREVLGIADAYASGFLVVWARTQFEHATNTPTDLRSGIAGLRDLATFEPGLEALIAGLDATLVRPPGP